VAGLTFTLWRPSFVVLHNTAVPTQGCRDLDRLEMGVILSARRYLKV
jgi:hypothetical protein